MNGCVMALALLTSHCALDPRDARVRPGVVASDRPRGCQPRDPGRIKPPRAIRREVGR